MVRYLTEKEVIFINAFVIKRYTPKEPAGIKDYSMFDSALNRPKASAFGEEAYTTIWEKAAALYANISQNHAFHNANKRTGFATMKQFLWVNGIRLIASEEEAEEYTMYVVKEKPDIKDIAIWIERNSAAR